MLQFAPLKNNRSKRIAFCLFHIKFKVVFSHNTVVAMRSTVEFMHIFFTNPRNRENLPFRQESWWYFLRFEVLPSGGVRCNFRFS